MKLLTFPTAELTAEAVTEQLISELNACDTREYNLAISGGSTPALLFQLWREQYNGLIAWERINLYWVDERCVSSDSPESNYGEAKRGFIDYLMVKPNHIYPIEGENDPILEAKRYTQLLEGNLPLHNGYPVFDMIILGIGPDGHTSSIFPGQKWLLESSNSYEATVHPVSGQARIALTAYPIFEAKRAIFHATGASKMGIFEAMLDPDPKYDDLYPAVYIAKRAKHCQLFTDQEMLSV